MEANQSCPHSCSEGKGKEKKNQIDLQLSSAHAIKSELFLTWCVCSHRYQTTPLPTFVRVTKN